MEKMMFALNAYNQYPSKNESETGKILWNTKGFLDNDVITILPVNLLAIDHARQPMSLKVNLRVRCSATKKMMIVILLYGLFN
jgi:hypothetical protein